MSIDVAAKVEQVNALLLAGEPGNISVDEQNDYTGYKPQAIVDAMNEGFGIGEWGFEEICSTIETTQGAKGPGLLAVAQVKVWLKGVEFQPTGWGQNRVTRGDLGDARKGAQTDAIKKTLSYFSIGNRAYHGLLEKNSKPALPPAKPAAKPARSIEQDEALRELAQPGPARAGKNLHVQAQPASDKFTEVKSLFLKMYKPEKWEPFKVGVLGLPVTDEGLSDSELARIHGKLVEIGKQKVGAALRVIGG